VYTTDYNLNFIMDYRLSPTWENGYHIRRTEHRWNAPRTRRIPAINS